MSSENKIIPVKIAGKQFDIKCPADKVADLQAAVSYFDAKLCEIRNAGKLLGMEKVAVMAGILVSNDLQQKQREIENMKTHIQLLQKKIEETLTQQGQFAI